MKKNYTRETFINQFRSDVSFESLKASIIKTSKNPSCPLAIDSVVKAFIGAGERYNVDPVYLVAHAALESAWGTSNIAVAKNNIYGYQAYDNSPMLSAKTFTSYVDCIWFVTEFIARQYLDPKGKWYGGSPNLQGMNVHYATAGHWADSIATLCNNLEMNRADSAEPKETEKPKYDFYAAEQTINVLPKVGVNIRTDPSINKTNIVGASAQGTKIEVSGYVVGETINGNSTWWKTKNHGYYVWSGGTDKIPENGLKHENVDDEVEEKPEEKVSDDIKAELQEVSTLKAQIVELENDNNAMREDLKQALLIRTTNETLVDQLEALKIQNQRLLNENKNCKAAAFNGWILKSFPKKVIGTLDAFNFAKSMFELLKNKKDTSLVVAWKKGAKIVEVV